MESFSRITVFFLLFSVLIIHQLHPAILQVNGQNVAQNQPKEKPSIFKILMDTISLIIRPHTSSWEKIKAVVHDMQRQFSPSTLEGVGETETELGIGGVKRTIKEAVAKNFEKGKMTVEESAKSAANVDKEAAHNTAEKVTNEKSNVAEEAVHNTAEKVTNEESDAEL